MNYQIDLGMLPRLSVSDVNSYIKRSFDADPFLQNVIISGEISNFSRHSSTGHMYFSLKDETGQLKSVMFRSDAASLNFIPENGMKVLASGRISCYTVSGEYQLYVRKLQPDGAGALALAFEQLKKKLSQEGLFGEKRKKRLPRFPKRIGVITSPTGAAVHDILTTLERRWPSAEVVLAPVSVQGAKAAWELTEAVKAFSLYLCADVIIIGRGGGSAEDLWCFNDEALARAIAACPVPVVSGVGHEVDFTICDFVADVRAATPTAAAELCSPDKEELLYGVSQTTERLFRAYDDGLRKRREELNLIIAKRDFSDPSRFFETEKNAVSALVNEMSQLRSRFISENRHRFEMLTGSLGSLNPLSVLLRGYSALEKDGKILSSVNDVVAGDTLRVKMSDGFLDCEVKKKWKKK